MRSLFTTLFYLAFLFGICPYSFSDGNQTQIATKTGVWQVVYNGENRPVRWQCGDMMESEGCTYVYALDGNKNVSEVLDESGNIVAHYEYAAFGDAVIVSGEKALANPFRFSSEYADDALGLTYYNYRHLDHAAGRWLSRDPIIKNNVYSGYNFINNRMSIDMLGLMSCCRCGTCEIENVTTSGKSWFSGLKVVNGLGDDLFEFEPDVLKHVEEKIVEIISKDIKYIAKKSKEIGRTLACVSIFACSMGGMLSPRIKKSIKVSYKLKHCKKKHLFAKSCIWQKTKHRTDVIDTGWVEQSFEPNTEKVMLEWGVPLISDPDSQTVIADLKTIHNRIIELADEMLGEIEFIKETLMKKTGCIVK